MTELPDSLAAWAQARLTEVEAKLVFAEDQIDALNQTVTRQQAQLDSLQAQLRLLYQQMQNVAPGDIHAPREEIPPHY
jgi:SlyX protein